jgi:GT2 family glycosyltransferase
MKINHLQIHDYNLNISARLNEAIDLLDDEWICLTDNDTLKFPSFAGNIRTLLESGTVTKNDVVGTMVNRLRPSNPAVVSDLFNESDINVHFNEAIDRWNKYETETFETSIVAGSCMIFHKSLWTTIGGFNQEKIFFDKYFSYDVATNGGKCYIAKGIYIFHLYRWGSENPVGSVEHLVK